MSNTRNDGSGTDNDINNNSEQIATEQLKKNKGEKNKKRKSDDVESPILDTLPRKRIKNPKEENTNLTSTVPSLDSIDESINNSKNTSQEKSNDHEKETKKIEISSSSSSSSSSDYLQLDGERVFSSKDFDHLTSNEYMRFLPNSKKIAHAVIVKQNNNREVAYQYALPSGGKDAPEIRPLINIEKINVFGMERYRASTPDQHTIMYAKRFIDAELKKDETKPDETIKLQIACFSPSKKEPFWGGKDKPTAIFSDNLKQSTQKELEKELKEIGVKSKGGAELIVDPVSVKERDAIKVRNPTQNVVMGESAKEAYENFLETMKAELHPDLKKVLKRSVEAKIKSAFYSNHRPEWLHAEGYGLTPLTKDPQQVSNLGAAPKWTNTEMMVLERIAKWFALNRPQSFITIKPYFEMLLDSELIKEIQFEVSIKENNRLIKFYQHINPFKEYPLFRKASDIAQGTAITYNLLNDIAPVSEHVIGARNPNSDAKPGSSSTAILKQPLSVSSTSAFSSVLPTHTLKNNEKAKNTLIMPTHLKYEKSLVQIITTYQEPNYDEPWFGTRVGSCTGSGSVISDQGKIYILTNAHVVENAVVIRVRLANDRKKKYEAIRKNISYQCDLALLEINDPEFLAIAKPLELGEMVNIQDKVSTIGFPMGGSEISVTKGVVSRIEVQDYAMSGLEMLQVQITAAINPGNSGGPVFSNGKIVGVAFQGYSHAQSLGYMIPTPIIQHFLIESLSKASYQGFPILPAQFQTLENPSLRQHYGMKEEQSGIRVTSIDCLSDAYKKLQTDDIVLEIDSLSISNEGTVDIPGIGSCINMLHVTHMKYIGDSVMLKVLRMNQDTKKAEIKDIEVILDHVPLKGKKVPEMEHDKMPTYYLSSGIAFTPLSRNYLDGKGSDLDEYYVLEEGCRLADLQKKTPNEQIVVINDILDCKETEGYETYVNSIVKEVNGKVINHINDVIEAMEKNKDPVHVITTGGRIKIIVTNMSKEKHDQLLKLYQIKFDRSEDLFSKIRSNIHLVSSSIPSNKPHHLNTTNNKKSQAHSQTLSDKNDEDKSMDDDLTAAQLPGYKKYLAKLDQMEAFYKNHVIDDEEDSNQEADEEVKSIIASGSDEGSDDENSLENESESDEETIEESIDESDEEQVVKHHTNIKGVSSSRNQFFNKQPQFSNEDDEDQVIKKAYTR